MVHTFASQKNKGKERRCQDEDEFTFPATAIPAPSEKRASAGFLSLGSNDDPFDL